MQQEREITHISIDLYLYTSKYTYSKDLVNFALVLKCFPKLKVMIQNWNQEGQNDKIKQLLEFKLLFETQGIQHGANQMSHWPRCYILMEKGFGRVCIEVSSTK